MKLKIQQNISLADYTTLHVGGVADLFVEVGSIGELKAALQYASKHTAAPPLILGGGSNLLISDEGYRGLVIKNSLVGITYEDLNDTEVLLSCGSGEVLDDVIEDATSLGYWGLENLSSIPGTVGATPIQNVGAYGVEVSSLITGVKAVHSKTLEEKNFTPQECFFSYRDSFFKTQEGRQWFVTEVSFKLSKKSAPKLSYGSLIDLQNQPDITPNQIRKTVQEIRAGKFPDWAVIGTAGSFFKNPIISAGKYTELKSTYPDLPGFELENGQIKLSLGWVLDKICGLRGYCEGGVCMFKQQALVLTNTGDSAKAVKKFQAKVAGIVKEKVGIDIEPEVRIV